MPRRRIGAIDQQLLQPPDADVKSTAANPHRPPADVKASSRCRSLGQPPAQPSQKTRPGTRDPSPMIQ